MAKIEETCTKLKLGLQQMEEHSVAALKGITKMGEGAIRKIFRICNFACVY